LLTTQAAARFLPRAVAEKFGNATMEQREFNDFLASHESKGAQGGSTPVALRYPSPKSAVEASAKTVDSRRRPASEVADLQRRAIVALEECAITNFLLSNALHNASRRQFDAIARARALLERQTRHFLDCAQQLVSAHARCPETEGSAFRKGGVPAPAGSDSFKARFASLTPQQRRTLSLLLTGSPNKVIAYELGVAESTVKAHVTAILGKLKVHSRAQAIAVAARLEQLEFVRLEAPPAPEGRTAMAECGPAKLRGEGPR
jgi:DNA-binding NarL/FixJ family response regulator